MANIKKVYVYEKAPNYSEKQEAELRVKAPHSKNTATAFAKRHKKSPYSVISKIKQMGLSYSVEDRHYKKSLSKEALVKEMSKKTGLKFSKEFHIRTPRKDLKTLKIFLVG